MSKWLTDLLKAVLPSLSARITHWLAYRWGKQVGTAEAEQAQKEADLEAIKRATDAGDAVDHSDASVMRDKQNRDLSGSV